MGGFFLILFGYLLGSLPTGYFLGLLAGLDIRREGSGNVGATNVARVVGKKQGLLTLLGDASKGYLPTVLSLQLDFSLTVTAAVALAAFLGHLYSPFLRFQGGKGVATALGVFLSVAPAGTFVLLAIFVSIALASRLISLASVITAGLAPIVFWLFSYPPVLVWLGLLVAVLITFRHRDNIRRLVTGVEPRFNL